MLQNGNNPFNTMKRGQVEYPENDGYPNPFFQHQESRQDQNSMDDMLPPPPLKGVKNRIEKIVC